MPKRRAGSSDGASRGRMVRDGKTRRAAVNGYRRAAMRLLVDTTPLRVSRDFRRLWIGQAVSVFGTTVTTAALPFQVFEQTGSSLARGVLRAAGLGAPVPWAVVGGSVGRPVYTRPPLPGL